MAKKSSAKIWAVFGVMLIAVCLVGASIYLYMDQQQQTLTTRIDTLQDQLTALPVAPVSPAYLALTATNPIDFEDEIDANGEVPTAAWNDEASGVPTLDIENADTVDVATGVYIMLYDPVSGAQGLPTALENTTMSIYGVFSGVTTPLYLNTNGVGVYTGGIYLGNLAVGATTSLEITGYLDATGVEDTYDDASDYTVTVYVYQSGASDSTPITFELNT